MACSGGHRWRNHQGGWCSERRAARHGNAAHLGDKPLVVVVRVPDQGGFLVGTGGLSARHRLGAIPFSSGVGLG